eukprot:Nitzschia sp. Nitz4//scaffold11_size288233//130335//132095//NITZ4_000771-RA/size288233-processed-gene-0.163-mRNA-1//1//CDS//3329534065//7703//frame0
MGRRSKETKKRSKGEKAPSTSTKKQKSNPSSKEEDSPVVTKTINYDDSSHSKVPMIPLEPDLDTLLYPLPGSEFLQKHLRQRAVHCTCAPGNEAQHAERVRDLCKEMFDLDVPSILRETSSDNVFLWLRKSINDLPVSNKKHGERELIQSIEISDVDTAVALHKIGGHATYCRAPPQVEQPLVSSLLRGTGLGCGQYDPSGDSMTCLGRGEVETFVSTLNHFTNWHYDFQENFTIQLSGVKRWTLQQGTIADPLRGCTPHYAAPQAVEAQLKAANLFDRKFQFGYPQDGVNAKGSVVYVDLKPGDVFYFPAGMWHKIETLEPGVSINVSLMATNYVSVVGQAIQHYLFQFPEWRQPLLHNPSSNALKHLQGLLDKLPTTLQGFCRADAIVPPILQFPPRFESMDGEVGDDDEGSEGWQVVNDEESTPEDKSEDEDNNDDGEAQGSIDEDELVESSDDDIVDPSDFDGYPLEWELELPEGKEITLVRNPLAVLHQMKEIKSFYRGDNEEESDGAAVFVLNVSYAGNEMHESAIRVVFASPKNCVTKLYKSFELSAKRSPSVQLKLTAEEEPFIRFLVFHGYITVQEK